MGQVFFYHLTRSEVARAVSALVARCTAAGWRVVVRGGDAERLEALDRALWLGPKDGFLPHGLAGGAHDDRQPVLLTTRAGKAPNGAQALMGVDAAPIAPDEVAAYERVMIVFDDKHQLAPARAQWKALVAAGCVARYWHEQDGGWKEKDTRPSKAAPAGHN